MGLLLLKHWKIIVMGILLSMLTVSGYYIKLLKSQKDTLVAEKNLVQAALEVSQGSVLSLQEAIADQNTAIEKLKQESDAREEAGKKLIEKAKADARRYKKRAEDLMKIKPLPGKTDCESANELINQEIRNAK